MSKFRFIMSRGELLLAEYREEGVGAEFVFPKETVGSLTVGSQSYPLSCGRVTFGMRGAPDGSYRPRLITGDGEYTLPEISKSGNLITFVGYSKEEMCAAFDELRRLKKSYRELAERYKIIEEYVFGKGIF